MKTVAPAVTGVDYGAWPESAGIARGSNMRLIRFAVLAAVLAAAHALLSGLAAFAGLATYAAG
jgi:hypothetical protein